MSEPWTPAPWYVGTKEYVAEGAEAFSIGHAAAFDVGSVWSEADARLIAAAPEMAELLERAIEIVAGTPDNLGWIPTTEALLSRVRGGDTG